MRVLEDRAVRDRRGMLGDRVVYTPPRGAHRRTIRKAYLKVSKRYKYGRRDHSDGARVGTQYSPLKGSLQGKPCIKLLPAWIT